MWLLPLPMFLVSGFIVALLTYDVARHQAIDVIRQVQRYPVNGQWITISSDTHNRLSQDGQQKLQTACKRDGIGLLRVSAGAKVTVLETARQRPTPDGLSDFLVRYARGDAMRTALQRQAQCGEEITATVYA